MLALYLRYKDLVERGVVKNRVSLRNLILKHKFPAGRMIGPNTRVWTAPEVQEYIDNCPTEPKKALPAKKPRGRPRKIKTDETATT